MALKTFVKVSGINNLGDARYCAGMGVDMLGFALDPSSPGLVNESSFREMAGWVSGVRLVGELGGADAAQAADLLTRYAVDCLQTDRTDIIPQLAALRVPLILRTSFAENSQLSLKDICAANRPYVDFFLLESETVVLTEYEMSFLRRLALKYPVLLGFGFGAANIHFLLGELPIKGIAMRGTRETGPGSKDFEELAEVLEAIETEG